MGLWEDQLARFDELVGLCPRFERKGKSMIYTSANGHMFSILNKEGEMGVRFSKEIQKKYFEEFNTTFIKSYGAKMNGYILIPDSLLKDTEKMCELLNESYDYVMSLDPK